MLATGLLNRSAKKLAGKSSAIASRVTSLQGNFHVNNLEIPLKRSCRQICWKDALLHKHDEEVLEIRLSPAGNSTHSMVVLLHGLAEPRQLILGGPLIDAMEWCCITRLCLKACKQPGLDSIRQKSRRPSLC